MKRLTLVFMVCASIVSFGGPINLEKKIKEIDRKILEAQQGIEIPTQPVNHVPIVTNPIPLNNATGIATSTPLSWAGGDPDIGNTVTYDVYFGTVSPPVLVSANQVVASYNPGALIGSTTYYWQVVSRDNLGSETVGAVWKFTTVAPAPVPSNNSPVIESLSATPSLIFRSQIATITCNASDPDGDPLEYQWSATGGTILIQGVPGPIIPWQAPATPDTFTISCRVRDNKGATDEKNVSVTVVVQTTFHLAGRAYGVYSGEIDFEGVQLLWDEKSNLGTLSGYAWGSTVGTLSFESADLQSPWIGTITYCKIRESNKLIGWGRFINITDPEENGASLCVSNDNYKSPKAEIVFNVVFDRVTGKFSGWSWGDSGSKGGKDWVNWGSYYGSQYGVYIKDWK